MSCAHFFNFTQQNKYLLFIDKAAFEDFKFVFCVNGYC